MKKSLFAIVSILSLCLLSAQLHAQSGKVNKDTVKVSKGTVTDFRWEFSDDACSATLDEKYVIFVSAHEGKPDMFCRLLLKSATEQDTLIIKEIDIPALLTVVQADKPDLVVDVIRTQGQNGGTLPTDIGEVGNIELDAGVEGEKVDTSHEGIEEQDLMERDERLPSRVVPE